MNNDSSLFSCCSALCDSGCCLWPGCVSCGYDKDGNPNLDNVYLLFINQPEKLAEFFVNVSKINKTFDLWTQNPGTFPMFSNETSHDWLVNADNTVTIPTQKDYDKSNIDPSSKQYIVYGTPKAKSNPDKSIETNLFGNTYNEKTDGYPTSKKPSKLCGAMKWQAANGFLCGTFDGLGIWKWSQVVLFLVEFSKRTGIQELGIYDAQFLMPHWFKEDSGDMAKAFKKCKNIIPDVPIVPAFEGEFDEKTPQSYDLKLHLYLGGWPNFNVDDFTNSHKDNKGNTIYDATTQSEGLWTDICLFCEQNKQIIKYIYIDVDASGLKIQDKSVESKPWLTSVKLAELASQLLESSPDIVLGAVITANPSDGFLPHTTDLGFDYKAYTGVKSGDQPGGDSIDPTKWSTPDKPVNWDGNNSYCQNIQYGDKPGKTGCPNSIQNAIYFMQQTNKILNTKKKTLFTRFIQDGENNHTATAAYCVWWNSIKKYMGDVLNMKDVRVGQAFSDATNTGGISDDSLGGKCGIKKSNFIALPELYWYTDFLKDGLGDKYIKTDPNVVKLITLLKGNKRTGKEAIHFLTNGAGCEGCDHNHIAPARQVNKLGYFKDEFKVGVESDSGWPSFIKAPGNPCTSEFKTNVCDPNDKKCTNPYGFCLTKNDDAYLGHYGCTSSCIQDYFSTVWYPEHSKDCIANYHPSKYNVQQTGFSCGGPNNKDISGNYCESKVGEFLKSDDFKKMCPVSVWPKDQQIKMPLTKSYCESDGEKCSCKINCDNTKNPELCAIPPAPGI